MASVKGGVGPQALPGHKMTLFALNRFIHKDTYKMYLKE
jgi:hypothetical protein